MSFKSLLRFLTSMKTAIAVFVALGIIASFGTVIPQGLSSDVYLQEYGPGQGQFILTLGLDHLYRTWWFSGLGAVLIFLLLLCTLRRLRSVRNLIGAGSILLHLAFVVIVLGSGITGLSSQSEVVQLGIGESKSLQSPALSDYTLAVEDFRVSFYDNSMPSQYETDLSLTDPQGITFHDTILVNYPYNRQHIKIYQYSFGWEVQGSYREDRRTVDFRLKEGEGIDLNDGSRLMAVFIPHFDEHTQSMESLSQEPKNPVLAVGRMQDDTLQNLVLLRPGDRGAAGSVNVTFENYAPYTGLEVKKDRGIPVVLTGFVLFIAGLLLRYLPIWFHRERRHSK